MHACMYANDLSWWFFLNVIDRGGDSYGDGDGCLRLLVSERSKRRGEGDGWGENKVRLYLCQC